MSMYQFGKSPAAIYTIPAVPHPVYFDGHGINIITDESPDICARWTRSSGCDAKSNSPLTAIQPQKRQQNPLRPSRCISPTETNVKGNRNAATARFVGKSENAGKRRPNSATMSLSVKPGCNPNAKPFVMPIPSGTNGKTKRNEKSKRTRFHREQKEFLAREGKNIANETTSIRQRRVGDPSQMIKGQMIAIPANREECNRDDDKQRMKNKGESAGKSKGNHLRTHLLKTEMCRVHASSGWCHYGDRCAYAHGVEELQPVFRSKIWRTKPCRQWSKSGYCPYEHRCDFLHDRKSPGDARTNARAPVPTPTPKAAKPLYLHYEINNRTGNDYHSESPSSNVERVCSLQSQVTPSMATIGSAVGGNHIENNRMFESDRRGLTSKTGSTGTPMITQYYFPAEERRQQVVSATPLSPLQLNFMPSPLPSPLPCPMTEYPLEAHRVVEARKTNNNNSVGPLLELPNAYEGHGVMNTNLIPDSSTLSTNSYDSRAQRELELQLTDRHLVDRKENPVAAQLDLSRFGDNSSVISPVTPYDDPVFLDYLFHDNHHTDIVDIPQDELIELDLKNISPSYPPALALAERNDTTATSIVEADLMVNISPEPQDLLHVHPGHLAFAHQQNSNPFASMNHGNDVRSTLNCPQMKALRVQPPTPMTSTPRMITTAAPVIADGLLTRAVSWMQ